MALTTAPSLTLAKARVPSRCGTVRHGTARCGAVCGSALVSTPSPPSLSLLPHVPYQKPKRRRSGSSTLPGPALGGDVDKPKMNHNVKVILAIVLLAGLSESIGFGATLTAYLYMATGDEVRGRVG